MASDLTGDFQNLHLASSSRRRFPSDMQHQHQHQHQGLASPHSSEEFPDESSLFVGDLSRSVTEETLQHKFSAYGEVEGVDIKRDKVTKNNLGYGFVKFRTRQQAEIAKQKLHGAEIGGRNIRIGWAQKNTNLFVGDLDGRITSKQLQEIFREFGPIYEEDTFVKKNKYGFVKFKYRAHAERAKQELDGQPLTIPGTDEMTDRPIRIGWGDANTQRNCVHVQFDASAAEIHGVQEEDFRKHFSPYGHVQKVSLPRYADRRLKGYGFIHFLENDDGEESAARAITTLSGRELRGVIIQCNFGKRQNNRHKRHAKGGIRGFEDYQSFPMQHLGMNAPPPFPMYGGAPPYGQPMHYPQFAPQMQPQGGMGSPMMMGGNPFHMDGRGMHMQMEQLQMSPHFHGGAPPPHPGPRLGPPPIGGAFHPGGLMPNGQQFSVSPDPNRLRGLPASPSPSVPSPLFGAGPMGSVGAYENENSILPPQLIGSASNAPPVMMQTSPPMMPTIPIPMNLPLGFPNAMPMPTQGIHGPSLSPLFVSAGMPQTIQVSPTLQPRPPMFHMTAARQG